MAIDDAFADISKTDGELNAAQKARKKYTKSLTSKATNFIMKVCGFKKQQ
jgi:hypothetical protein